MDDDGETDANHSSSDTTGAIKKFDLEAILLTEAKVFILCAVAVFADFRHSSSGTPLHYQSWLGFCQSEVQVGPETVRAKFPWSALRVLNN